MNARTLILLLAVAAGGCVALPPKPLSEAQRLEIARGVKPAGVTQEAFDAERAKTSAVVAEIREQESERDQTEKERKARFYAEHPELTASEREAIAKRWFTNGMRREVVAFSMGSPNDKTMSGGLGGSSEVWRYSTVTLFFLDGRVARWVQHTGSR